MYWVILYLFILLTFTVFSYTQVDLNLTLFNSKLYLVFQNQLNQLGYYHREINTQIFIFAIILLNIFYLSFLRFVQKGTLSTQAIKRLAILTGFILFLGY